MCSATDLGHLSPLIPMVHQTRHSFPWIRIFSQQQHPVKKKQIWLINCPLLLVKADLVVIDWNLKILPNHPKRRIEPMSLPGIFQRGSNTPLLEKKTLSLVTFLPPMCPSNVLIFSWFKFTFLIFSPLWSRCQFITSGTNWPATTGALWHPRESCRLLGEVAIKSQRWNSHLLASCQSKEHREGDLQAQQQAPRLEEPLPKVWCRGLPRGGDPPSD